MQDFILLHAAKSNTPIVVKTSGILIISKKSNITDADTKTDKSAMMNPKRRASTEFTTVTQTSNPTVIKVAGSAHEYFVEVNESVERIYEMLKKN